MWAAQVRGRPQLRACRHRELAVGAQHVAAHEHHRRLVFCGGKEYTETGNAEIDLGDHRGDACGAHGDEDGCRWHGSDRVRFVMNPHNLVFFMLLLVH